MVALRQLLYMACIAVLLFASACAAHPPGKSVRADLPSDEVIKAFIGAAQARFPSESDAGAVSVYDRIMDGFELGPQRLALNDGSAIYWGEKYQEGNLQSVIIVDTQDHVRLMAVADNITAIARGGKPLIASIEQYRAEMKRRERYGSSNSLLISVFVKNAGDLNAYLPYLMRWLQADLLGFNVQCDKNPGMTRACAMAGQIALPVHAYTIVAGKPEVRAIPVPKITAAPVPLSYFRW